jgi:hypothetical protein
MTRGVKEANAGGTTGLRLARLGVKALIIEGDAPADRLSILLLSPAGGRFEPAGDLAGLGVYETGRRLIERYGRDNFLSSMIDCMDYSEARARALIRRIPPGTYRFHDYLDDDVASDIPVRLEVAVTVADGGLHIDYSGTDTQLRSAFNLYCGAAWSSCRPATCCARRAKPGRRSAARSGR